MIHTITSKQTAITITQITPALTIIMTITLTQITPTLTTLVTLTI
jgi:hypothetical protein